MIEDLFAYNKSALDVPEVQDLINRCKHVESINTKLFNQIKDMKNTAESLVVIAFSICELRDVWRKKFGLPTKCEGEKETL